MQQRISVSIVYAHADKQWLRQLHVARGTSAVELVELSGICKEIVALNKIPIHELQLGVFAQKIAHDHLLQEGDRVEIYRSLLADPKEVRRELAKLKAKK